MDLESASMPKHLQTYNNLAANTTHINSPFFSCMMTHKFIFTIQINSKGYTYNEYPTIEVPPFLY